MVTRETHPGAPTVLVIDELPSVIRMLTLELSSEGFNVAGAEVGEDTFRAMEEIRPDVVLLEIMLPGISGYEVLRDLRERYTETPVVILSTQASDQDRALALELGAADYLPKPFSPSTLSTLLSALLHRQPAGGHGRMRSGNIEVDTGMRIVWKSGMPVTLGVNEWAILYSLIHAGGRPVPASELLERTFGAEYVPEPQLLDAFIRRLRHKLEDDPGDPRVITGDAASGYAFRTGDV